MATLTDMAKKAVYAASRANALDAMQSTTTNSAALAAGLTAERLADTMTQVAHSGAVDAIHEFGACVGCFECGHKSR